MFGRKKREEGLGFTPMADVPMGAPAGRKGAPIVIPQPDSFIRHDDGTRALEAAHWLREHAKERGSTAGDPAYHALTDALIVNKAITLDEIGRRRRDWGLCHEVMRILADPKCALEPVSHRIAREYVADLDPEAEAKTKRYREEAERVFREASARRALDRITRDSPDGELAD